MIKNPKAESTKNESEVSSSAVRLIAMCKPSSASSKPASVPIAFELVSLRAIRAVSSTLRIPRIAIAILQPKGVAPKTASPLAIIHLPTGGCTTNEAASVKIFW